MAQQTAERRTNPSEEVIRLGPLMVHLLVTGENSSSSSAAFELTSMGGDRLMAPAHSHNVYEETIYGVDRALTLDSVAVTAELAKCNLLEWAEPLGSSAQMLPSLGLVSLSGELMSQEIRGSFAWGD